MKNHDNRVNSFKMCKKEKAIQSLAGVGIYSESSQLPRQGRAPLQHTADALTLCIHAFCLC